MPTLANSLAWERWYPCALAVLATGLCAAFDPDRFAFPAVGIQIVSCELDHIVPATRPIHFSRTFVGQLGPGAESRSLSRCLGST